MYLECYAYGTDRRQAFQYDFTVYNLCMTILTINRAGPTVQVCGANPLC